MDSWNIHISNGEFIQASSNMKIDVIVPIYKEFDEVKSLYCSLLEQKDVEINKIIFPFTLSNETVDDELRVFIKENGIVSFEMPLEKFSHSLTREKAIREYAECDVVLLMSQDVKLVDEHSIYNLVKEVNNEVVYVFGKQICTNKSIEKYIRKKNYPETSYVVSKEDIEAKQLMAFFASDAFSALNRNVFIDIGGYQGYDIMMGEDMLYSKFVLDHGYKKKYVAEAVVEHSHKYTLKQLYDRYYETGKFHKQVGLFENYKSTDSGMKLALYVLKEALKHFDIPVLFRWLPDMTSRYLGMKKGKKAK